MPIEKANFQYNLNEVRKAFDPNADDWITLFIKSVILMKYDINYKAEKMRCKEEKQRFDRKKVPPGIVEPHAFVMISSLKMFIDEYDKTLKLPYLYKHVEKHLLDKKSELYFNGINVKFKPEEKPQLIQTVDALCVRFYQEVLYAITESLCDHNLSLNIGVDETANSYIFEVSDMSILEIHEYKTAKRFPYRQGFIVRNGEKIQA